MFTHQLQNNVDNVAKFAMSSLHWYGRVPREVPSHQSNAPTHWHQPFDLLQDDDELEKV